MQVRAAVGQRDHLREGVRPLGAAQQRGMADLRGEAAGGTAGAEGGGEEGGHWGGCWWHFFVVVWCGFLGNNCCNGRPSMLLLDGWAGGGELAEMERAWRRIRADGPQMAMRLKLHDVCSLISRRYCVARGLSSIILDPSIFHTTLATGP